MLTTVTVYACTNLSHQLIICTQAKECTATVQSEEGSVQVKFCSSQSQEKAFGAVLLQLDEWRRKEEDLGILGTSTRKRLWT